MSIATSIKEHFNSNPLKYHFQDNSIRDHWNNHWNYFFQGNLENTVIGSTHNGSDLNFRRFCYEDLDECAELFKEVFSSYPWFDDWGSLNQTIIYLNELMENPAFDGVVALEDAQIVGVCLGHRKSWWAGKEFFVDEFFVSNHKQGNGIGTKLLTEIDNYLVKEEYTRLILLTNKGIPAEGFYRKNGFYNNQKRTIMVKEL